MIKILKYFSVFIIMFVILSCESRVQRKLPQSMTLEEIKKTLPVSKAHQVNEIERTMIKHQLVDVQKVDEEIRVDLKYSSKDNFFKENVYGSLEVAYLQPEVAEALSRANSLLISEYPDLRLMVYDGARPLSVQQILWEKLDSMPESERKNYVADPDIGSIHNYGCAVDLTIFNLQTGKALDMGTKFDYFGPEAYPRLEQQMINEGRLNPLQLNNRLLLRRVMEENGFSPITSEWWHFNYLSRVAAQRKYKIID